MATNPLPPAGRDLRLDFIRGLALLVIYINHVPLNEGRFFTFSIYGFSDAAEVFVFCSGFVAARAYGRSLEHAGLWLGSLRVLRRCAQIYTAHLGLFLALALLCVAAAGCFPDSGYLSSDDIGYFFENSREALPAVALLAFQPEFIDILPMYLVILLWLPVFWGLAQIHRALAWTTSLALYGAVFATDLNLSARPEGDQAWYFNPFAWQLIFFAGLSLGAGWVKVPLGKPRAVAFSVLVILGALPLSQEAALRPTEWLMALYAAVEPWTEKCRLAPLRLLHFAALAYLAASLLRNQPRWLHARLAGVIRTAGSHSLTIFCVGVVLARVGGIVLDQAGHGLWVLMAVNCGGVAVLILAGQLIAWIDGQPWKHAPAPRHSAAEMGVREWRLSSAALAAWLFLPCLAISPFLLPRNQPESLVSGDRAGNNAAVDASLSPAEPVPDKGGNTDATGIRDTARRYPSI